MKYSPKKNSPGLLAYLLVCKHMNRTVSVCPIDKYVKKYCFFRQILREKTKTPLFGKGYENVQFNSPKIQLLKASK